MPQCWYCPVSKHIWSHFSEKPLSKEANRSLSFWSSWLFVGCSRTLTCGWAVSCLSLSQLTPAAALTRVRQLEKHARGDTSVQTANDGGWLGRNSETGRRLPESAVCRHGAKVRHQTLRAAVSSQANVSNNVALSSKRTAVCFERPPVSWETNEQCDLRFTGCRRGTA